MRPGSGVGTNDFGVLSSCRIGDVGFYKNHRVMVAMERIRKQKPIQQEGARCLNPSVDMPCLANLHGYCICLNPVFTRMLGYTEEELLSRPFMDFIHHQDRIGTESAMPCLAKSQFSIAFTNRYLCHDQSVRRIHETGDEEKIKELNIQAYLFKPASCQELAVVARQELDHLCLVSG